MSGPVYTVRLLKLHPTKLKGFHVKDVSGECNKCGPRAISEVLVGNSDQCDIFLEIAVQKMLTSPAIAPALDPGNN